MNGAEAKECINANPGIYFQEAKKTGYVFVCSICENGSGRDGAGITENPQNKGNYKRFKRGESGDALHFIGSCILLEKNSD
jgi:hypothetical protein